MRSRPTDIAPTLPKLTVTFLKNVQGKLIRVRLTIDALFNLAKEATLYIAWNGTFDPFWALVEEGFRESTISKEQVNAYL